MGILKSMLSVRLNIILIAAFSLCDVTASELPSIPFSFENQKVNQSIIALYESEAESWGAGQLFLVGMCYLHDQRLGDAQRVFERLRGQAPDDYRSLVALGNIYHMTGRMEEAQAVYLDAWRRGRNTVALKQLAVLRLQLGDQDGVTAILEDLLAHQKAHVEIQKVLLAYSLGLEDLNMAGPIFAAVASALDDKIISENPDLRKLLILGSLRFSEDGDEVETEVGNGAADEDIGD